MECDILKWFKETKRSTQHDIGVSEDSELILIIPANTDPLTDKLGGGTVFNIRQE